MSGTFGNAMAADTIDRDTQEWERIREAIAFRTLDDDELLIMRKVDCADCGNVYTMVLGNGDVVHYGKRHRACDVNKVFEKEAEAESNG